MTASVSSVVAMPGFTGRLVRQHKRPSTVLTGTHAVPLTELRRVLGVTALQVWYELLRLRDSRGLVAVTAAAIGSRVLLEDPVRRLSLDGARRALRRLTAAGLVRRHSCRKGTPRGAGTPNYQTWRQVRGSAVGPGVRNALVPRETELFLGLNPTWGGKRAGAGRPKGSKDKAPRKTQGKARPAGVNQDARTVNQEHRHETIKRTRSQRELGSRGLHAVSYETAPPAGCPEPAGQAEASPSDPDGPRTLHVLPRGQAAVGSPCPPAAPVGALPAPGNEAPSATRLRSAGAFEPGAVGSVGRAAASKLRPHPAKFGAAYPGVPRTVRALEEGLCLLVPSRPLLVPADTLERKVQLLRRWYEGAVVAYGGHKRPKELGHPRPITSKNGWWRMLVNAVAAFEARGIAPAAWCEYWVDTWREEGNAGPPPFELVFAAKTINAPRGWFSGRNRDYDGARVVYPEEVRVLLRRQEAMRLTLAWEQAFEPEAVAAVVGRFFPGDFEAEVHRARLTAEAANAALKARADNGEWVWSVSRKVST